MNKSYFGIICIIIICIVSFPVIGDASDALSRRKAQKMIDSFFSDNPNTIRIVENEYMNLGIPMAISLPGMPDMVKRFRNAVRGEFLRMEEKKSFVGILAKMSLTRKGRKCIVKKNDQHTIIKLGHFVVEKISGITAPVNLYGNRICRADFEYKFITTSFGKAFYGYTNTSYIGQTSQEFVLYDDGWRLESPRLPSVPDNGTANQHIYTNRDESDKLKTERPFGKVGESRLNKEDTQLFRKNASSEITEEALCRYFPVMRKAIDEGDSERIGRLWSEMKQIREKLESICMADLRDYSYLESCAKYLTGGYRNLFQFSGYILDYQRGQGSSSAANLKIRRKSNGQVFNYTVSDWTVFYNRATRKVEHKRKYSNLKGRLVSFLYDRPSHYGPNDARILVISWDEDNENRRIAATFGAMQPIDGESDSAQFAVTGDETITNSIGMTFKLIRPGSFMMGSPGSEAERHNDEVRHKVTLTKGFYIQSTEVTQEQWTAVMTNNPSKFKGCAKCPVEQVSWNDVQQFIDRLNEKEKGRHYRLPTEAEWEYAARAGTGTAYSFGDDSSRLQDYAWYRSNARNKTHPVAGKKPNAWGLYDMHGNVCEWCQDWRGHYPSGNIEDPWGPSDGSSRVARGGTWSGDARYCRSADRVGGGPDGRAHHLGFRLALSPGQ